MTVPKERWVNLDDKEKGRYCYTRVRRVVAIWNSEPDKYGQVKVCLESLGGPIWVNSMDDARKIMQRIIDKENEE